MVFGLNGHVDDVNVIFGIDLWCFKVLGEVRAVRALYSVLLGLKILITSFLLFLFANLTFCIPHFSVFDLQTSFFAYLFACLFCIP
jgi:hypothetical protein